MVDSLLNETPYDSTNIEFDSNKITYEIDRKFNFKRIDLDTTITDKDAAKTCHFQWKIHPSFLDLQDRF